MIRQGCKPPLDQGHSSCCEVGVTNTFTFSLSKMPSRYFEGNAQPEHYSNIEDFYHQIYFETVDTVANYIVECFNQKNYTMYANWAGSSERNFGDFSYKMSTNYMSSTHKLTLIPYEFSYLYWQSPITVSGKVKGVVHCIMSLISSNRTKESGSSYQGPCPWSRLLWLPQQQMPALNVNNVEQLPQSSYDMHSS